MYICIQWNYKAKWNLIWLKQDGFINLLQAVCSETVHFINFLLSQLSIVQLDLIYRATCIDIPRSRGSLADDQLTISPWSLHWWCCFCCVGSNKISILVCCEVLSKPVVHHDSVKCLTDNHYRTIYEAVKIELTSYRVLKGINWTTVKTSTDILYQSHAAITNLIYCILPLLFNPIQ